MFLVVLVSLSVCKQHYSKSYGLQRDFMEGSGVVQ